MKRDMMRSLCVLLVMLLGLGSTTALADEKNETVYVLADAAGQPNRVIVSECVTDDAGAKTTTQSESDKALPVSVSIRYELDGEPIEPADLAGKSGKVTIRFEYDNKEKQTVDVDGKEIEVYTPFAMVSGMMLDSDKFANVEISNGKVISEGN